MTQQRGAANAPAVSHPAFQPHPVQGWTPDFIPYVLQESLDRKFYDQLIPIAGPTGIEWSRKLAQKEGIFTGISGGATFAVAMQVAEKAPAGSVIFFASNDLHGMRNAGSDQASYFVLRWTSPGKEGPKPGASR